MRVRRQLRVAASGVKVAELSPEYLEATLEGCDRVVVLSGSPRPEELALLGGAVALRKPAFLACKEPLELPNIIAAAACVAVKKVSTWEDGRAAACLWLPRDYDSYEEYLASVEWSERKHEAIRRADGMCQLCCSRAELEVHHRTYERIGREGPMDLTVLCGKCHGKFHEKEA